MLILGEVVTLQVVAYNKIDLPDSSDYIDDVREFLEQQGVAPQNILAISAATGQGVLDVVRRTRVLLDEIPEPVSNPVGNHARQVCMHAWHQYKDGELVYRCHPACQGNSMVWSLYGFNCVDSNALTHHCVD